jgi:hypothetical protein
MPNAPGIEHRRLQPRVGANQQHEVGLLEAQDGRVGRVLRAHVGINLREALLKVRVAGAEAVDEVLTDGQTDGRATQRPSAARRQRTDGQADGVTRRCVDEG